MAAAAAEDSGKAASDATLSSEELPGGGRRFRAQLARGNGGGSSDGSTLTVSAAADLLRDSPAFALELGDRIASVASAVFWECAPASASTASSAPFEFVVLPAPALNGVSSDAAAFEEHFDCSDSGVAPEAAGVSTFANLGGDAVLVAPCPSPSTAPEGYPHLAAFLRAAPKAQRLRFWASVADALVATLRKRADAPVWLSTSGLGVYWLHARLDSRPKYYQHQPYIRWPRQD